GKISKLLLTGRFGVKFWPGHGALSRRFDRRARPPGSTCSSSLDTLDGRIPFSPLVGATMAGGLLRLLVMAALLVSGAAWLAPRDPSRMDPGTRYEEIAARAGCLNHHTMPRLSPRFQNIMPWLTSVG